MQTSEWVGRAGVRPAPLHPCPVHAQRDLQSGVWLTQAQREPDLWEEGLVIEVSGVREGHQQRQPRAGRGLPHAQIDTYWQRGQNTSVILGSTLLQHSPLRFPLWKSRPPRSSPLPGLLSTVPQLPSPPSASHSQRAHVPHLPRLRRSVTHQTSDSGVRSKELAQMTVQVWTQIFFKKRLKGTRGQYYNPHGDS